MNLALSVVRMILAVVVLHTAVLAGGEKKDDNNVPTVPPPGVEPFAPRPLMDKLNERITTDNFKFAVFGDAKHAKTLPAFLKYLDETVNPDFVLTTGDMVKSGGGKVGPGYYEMYAKEAGDAMRKRAWWPAIGNHEIAGAPIVGKEAQKDDSETMRKNKESGAAHFKQFYALDDDHYSFTFRNCTFIALPFPLPKGAQIKWLEDELKKAREAKKHIIVFNHAPFFTVGQKSKKDIPNTETEITNLFQKYAVNAVFSGHDHGYYRTVRSGIPYFTSAGGGADIYPGKRVNEALKEDVYYYGVPNTFPRTTSKDTTPDPLVDPEPDPKEEAKSAKKRYMLHKNDGTPNRVTEGMEQFLSVVEVNGDKIVCTCYSTKGDKW